MRALRYNSKWSVYLTTTACAIRPAAAKPGAIGHDCVAARTTFAQRLQFGRECTRRITGKYPVRSPASRRRLHADCATGRRTRGQSRSRGLCSIISRGGCAGNSRERWRSGTTSAVVSTGFIRHWFWARYGHGILQQCPVTEGKLQLSGQCCHELPRVSVLPALQTRDFGKQARDGFFARDKHALECVDLHALILWWRLQRNAPVSALSGWPRWHVVACAGL